MALRSTRKCPTWLLAVWWVLLAPSAYISGLLVFQRTYMFARHGPQMVGFGLAHSSSAGWLLLATFVMGLWVVIAAIWASAMTIRGARPWRTWALIAVTTFGLGVSLLPYGGLETPTLFLLGPGDQAPQIMGMAAAMGNRTQVRLMISRGTSINVRDEEESTPLIAACITRDADFVTWMLDLGADVSARDRDGITPLLSAISENQPDVIDVLLRRGADPRASAYGETALDSARKRGDPRIIALIEEALRRR